MNTNDTYYPDLITRYLSGEASPEEISELSAWIESNREHAALFDEFSKTWLKVTAGQIEEQLDPAREWEALLPKLSGIGAQGTGHRAQGTGHRVPASGIGQPASGTRQPTTDNRQPTTDNRQHTTDNRQPTTNNRPPKVIQIDGDHRPWQVRLVRISLIAAIALVLLIPTWVAVRYFTRAEVTRMTASGEVLEAVLPDGSTITLNAFASISYAEDFGKRNRDVQLNGEAYFEVNRDSLIPFVVGSGNSRIEVLGTSFFVDAGKETGNLKVVLVDGSLAVYFDKARSTGKTIIPGEKAELIHANQRIVISPNEDPNFLAWKTHHMIFLDDRLDMIVTTLNKVYQSNISLASENIASCRLTTSFDQQSLESVLNVIMVTLDLRAETTSSGIILYGKGCN